MESLRKQFAAMSQVSSVSLSYEIPDGNSSGSAGVYRFGTDSVQAITAATLTTDENYLNVYKMPLKAGAFFEGDATDSGKVILNETAIQALGWKNAYQAINQQLRSPNDPTIFTVKGIVKDFHFGSMQQRIGPVIFFNVQNAPIYRYLSFKLNPGNTPAAIQALQRKWSVLMPGAPFEYKFMDDTLASVYKTELQLKKASYTATILALIIVLLGVVGLISLSIQKRTKEIGVRKVLGSSIAGIMLLFIKEFLWVILIGGLVACPLSYLIMYKWLQHYAYRIDITAAPFVITIACLGLITVSLICVQTVKAALANPVASLRTEG